LEALEAVFGDGEDLGVDGVADGDGEVGGDHEKIVSRGVGVVLGGGVLGEGVKCNHDGTMGTKEDMKEEMSQIYKSGKEGD
jgi:hypothetical protein